MNRIVENSPKESEYIIGGSVSVLDEFLPRHVSEKRNKVCFDDEDSDEEESDSDSTGGLESNDSDEHEVTDDGDFEFDEVYVPGQHDGTYTEYVAEGYIGKTKVIFTESYTTD